MTFETLQKVKKLVMIISERVPFEPNMSELWAQLVTNNDLGLRMLYALDKAQILMLLTSKAKNYKFLYKPDKIFLGNTTISLTNIVIDCISVVVYTFFAITLWKFLPQNITDSNDKSCTSRWLVERMIHTCQLLLYFS